MTLRKMAIHFDRWSSWSPTTWALRLFVAHHSELNDLYWSFHPAQAAAMARARSHPSTTATSGVFPHSVDDAVRLPTPLGAWRNAFVGCANWVRLNAVLSAAAYFEVYFRTVAAMALESDPGVEAGASRKIDGAVLLKHGLAHNRYEDTERLVKGSWPQRLSVYREVFGDVPPDLSDRTGELEKIRILRNETAHAFGRELDASRFRCSTTPLPTRRVSEQRLKAILGVLEGAALAVERHLAMNHVGNYELIYLYHSTRGGLRERSPEFKKAIGRRFGTSPSKDYCTALIDYYETL